MNDLGKLITNSLLSGGDFLKSSRIAKMNYGHCTSLIIPMELESVTQYESINSSLPVKSYIMKDMLNKKYVMRPDNFIIMNYNEYLETNSNIAEVSNVILLNYVKVILRCKESVGVINDYILNVSYKNCIFQTGEYTSANYVDCMNLEGRTL